MSENLQQLLDQKDRDLELAARKNRLKALNNLIFILNRTFFDFFTSCKTLLQLIADFLQINFGSNKIFIVRIWHCFIGGK